MIIELVQAQAFSCTWCGEIYEHMASAADCKFTCGAKVDPKEWFADAGRQIPKAFPDWNVLYEDFMKMHDAWDEISRMVREAHRG